ncbi:Fe-S cluster assembly ATPase SufC [Finegoldia magna]|uniref:ABC transporter ATP-binding protein n=3 Tax=Finegoldia magna TaxID=1260 RepID=A0A133N3I9_FINMA|nr:Fe-S cluster assembly ATPase SufC [Finegoldia magna]EFK93363.1 FeS assembly ATPase SufC [Finegoldia magna ACS-171-V-Col3]EFL53844.1 FeS assembly ATPase SufC [Finegoldia magna BVS033A4]EGS34545.1 FeS assembly ATPase SufC [Finegoldia magna SY403409CC001050417]KXA10763.1 FeS assembly ATPase SufC [Finegoldia magna]MBS6928103.1 Fe-S cluster assembly ATPase SufC [Finegoldia magna]
MSKNLLTIKDLSARVGDKEILKNINLNINYGEVHVIMGPNGSGKSTLANVILNNPQYETTSGDILLDGESIMDLSTDKRAKKGIFMSFQNPMEVSGISVENFIRSAKIAKTDENIGFLEFREELEDNMDILEFDHGYSSRYLNVGFSGGEKKKNEILQMLMLQPKLAILDETDSGLDVDAVRTVSKGVREFLNENNSVIVITHHKEILKEVKPDFVHVIMDGSIVKEGSSELLDQIEEKGFNWIREEVK